jgi:hypothetical protein
VQHQKSRSHSDGLVPDFLGKLVKHKVHGDCFWVGVVTEQARFAGFLRLFLEKPKQRSGCLGDLRNETSSSRAMETIKVLRLCMVGTDPPSVRADSSKQSSRLPHPLDISESCS